MIISASKRTDIPAFYGEWFMNNLRKGSFQVRNPLYPKNVSQINFSPNDVECIVFWTKNPKPFFKYIREVSEMYNFYFTYSLNDYPQTIERHLPSLNERIESFKMLSKEIGADKTIWRYDPILFTDQIGVDYHTNAFRNIAQQLNGYTKKVVISIVDRYARNKSNLDSIKWRDATKKEVEELINALISVAKQNNILIQSCAENQLSEYGIEIGKCVDDKLISNLFEMNLSVPKSKEREGCNCVQSVDVGVYNTCLHDCAYCYANYSMQSVLENFKKHDKTSKMLVGELTKNDKLSHRKIEHHTKKISQYKLDGFIE